MGAWSKIWEHDEPFHACAPTFFIMLPTSTETPYLSLFLKGHLRFRGVKVSTNFVLVQEFYHAPILFITLQFFLSCSHLFVCFLRKNWEHDKKNWSMMSFLMSCSNIFVMLQLFLSCSNLFVCFLWKIWEHDKQNWSMINILGAWWRKCCHAPNFLSCSNFFYHAPIFLYVFCEKFGSMIKKIGAW